MTIVPRERSLMARARNLPDGYSAPSKMRVQKKESRIADQAWREFEAACKAFYGRDSGPQVFAGIRRGEHDFAFAAKFLLGIELYPWQVDAWDALMDHRYIAGMMANAGGKTTEYAVIKMLATFYRSFATPGWGQYRVLHLAPQETQALESKIKIDAILGDRAREQQYRVPGGFKYRPCLLTPFFQAVKHDNGQHQGYNIMDEGYATITYRSTAFKGQGSDGADPAMITWDEVRHERNLTHVLNVIILARFLRVPFGRLLVLFTPVGASPELVELYNRGKSQEPDDIDWWGIQLGLREANPGISEETIKRAERNIDKKYHQMIVGGKPIQPDGSMFAQDAVDKFFSGSTVEPQWLDDLPHAYERMVNRCAICAAKGQHHVGDGDRRQHPATGFLDPASSAAYDSTVATLLDLDPPDWPKHWYWVEYIEELPLGTRIQRVGLQVALMSCVIGGQAVGYDQNSALGHSVDDNVIEFPTSEDILASKFLEPELREKLRGVTLAKEPEVVPLDHNSKKEKDDDLAYMQAILDLEKGLSPLHRRSRSQTINYQRADKGLPTDCVMTQAGALVMAQYHLPDLDTERRRKSAQKALTESKETLKPQTGVENVYAGAGLEGDSYFGLPSEVAGVIESYPEGVF